MANIIIIVEINLLSSRIKQRLSGNKAEMLKVMESFLTSNSNIDKILLHFQRCFSGSSFGHSWALLYIIFPIRKQSSSIILSDQWCTRELFFMVVYFSFSYHNRCSLAITVSGNMWQWEKMKIISNYYGSFSWEKKSIWMPCLWRVRGLLLLA